MKISLIITTYNWPEALDRVLKSVSQQVYLPHEVIIADDGSGYETRLLIERWQDKFPVPIIHSWQEDDGFRLSESRNLAISRVSGNYIVMIDGDMVLDKKFILSHSQIAEPKFFIQGSRVIVNKDTSQKLLEKKVSLNFFSKGIKNRFNTLNIPCLRKLFTGSPFSDNGTRGCNMAFWLEDIVFINGFNCDFVGWGREDSELVTRLHNAGIKRKRLKLGGCAYHLYHYESERTMLPENDLLLQVAIENKLTKCTNGLREIS
ncbi:MAG: glycosyltransferase involved in cell wall biosynthesis [Moritella dasanensis]|jgi:glycosyltransferase involved in cell wall biosynthesis